MTSSFYDKTRSRFEQHGLTYGELPETDQARLGKELRRRFFALSGADASPAETESFRSLVDAVDAPAVLESEGLSLSPFPTRRFKLVRFIDTTCLPEAFRAMFAHPRTGMPDLGAVFVDPEELSFRTFENILPLDRLLAASHPDGWGTMRMKKTGRLGDAQDAEALTFALEMDEASRVALLSLDQLGVYAAPLNAASRGGRRFIFHSTRLSEALTTAVKEALPKRWAKGFVHVNPVFRMNRFAPSDDGFHRHVDTPYYDAANQHVSRFTMLIYLTGGQGEGLFRAGDDIALDEVEAFTAVVFKQDLEHEGAPFDVGNKVFLRTEWVFEDAAVEEDPGIAKMFAKACYLTGESVFAPELARYTHELYDRTAMAHWRGVDGATPNEPVFEKTFRGVKFVTNGHDYWFRKAQLSLRACTALAVMDLLNGKVFGEAFRKQCTSNVMVRDEPPSGWVPAWLAQQPDELSEPPFGQHDMGLLFPTLEEPDPEMCCPFHCAEFWDPARGAECVDLHGRAQEFARSRIEAAPVTMMGQEVYFDPARFVVEAPQSMGGTGKVHVLSRERLAPLNFAACWNDDTAPPNYLDVEATIASPELLVPPVLFRETEHGFHLMLDLFNNAWTVAHRDQAVPVPRVRRLGYDEYQDGTHEQRPWLVAANAGVFAVETPHEDPWWGYEETPVMQELYRKKR